MMGIKVLGHDKWGFPIFAYDEDGWPIEEERELREERKPLIEKVENSHDTVTGKPLYRFSSDEPGKT